MTVRRKRGRQSLLLLLNTSLSIPSVAQPQRYHTVTIPTTRYLVDRGVPLGGGDGHGHDRPTGPGRRRYLLLRPRHRLITAIPSPLHHAHDTISYLRSPRSPGGWHPFPAPPPMSAYDLRISDRLSSSPTKTPSSPLRFTVISKAKKK